MYIISKYTKVVSNSVECSNVNKRKRSTPGGLRPSIIFNCDNQVAWIHVDACEYDSNVGFK